MNLHQYLDWRVINAVWVGLRLMSEATITQSVHDGLPLAEVA
ncbi:MAG: hypothetical protein AB4040_12870 [Synechococcus sp.]